MSTCRRRHSTIDRLEPGVRDTVDKMLLSGAYYREVKECLRQNGVKLSISSIAAYAKRLADVRQKSEAIRRDYQALAAAMEQLPELDVAEGIIRVLGNHFKNAAQKASTEENGSAPGKRK
ncbi:MAG TPA: hypothetical protein DEQ02_08690 [Ruminococcaceae bacterium]|nr:hypothetical protein [Oscillospiraceae bacterium]